ncbi:MAG: carotenoid biosynthesis protein [Opitutales bacterium]|nr:carotenoid biosynthesis protein [Opitutales bacterium]NRA27257.1 carotenoid biosynthesis protein [Opitutales bacterium]
MSKKTWLGIYILVVFHLVGAIGFFTPLRDWFEWVTPGNLLLCLFVVVFCQSRLSVRDNGLLLLVGVLGILAEIAGVATGLVFGDYSYGATLGWKIAGVPWVIGINWALLVWGVLAWLRPLKIGKIRRCALGATLMVALDFFIEPVAIELDFWSWAGGDVPLQNYIAWWVLGFLFGLILEFFSSRELEKDWVVKGFFVVQWLFFIPLFLFLPKGAL